MLGSLNSLRRFDWLEWSYRLLQRFAGHRTPQTLPLELERKRIYIVPTRFGLFFGLLLFVLLLGGLNYNNNMALLFTFLLSGVALLSPLYTVRNLAGLRVVQVTAAPVFAGEPAEFVLTLQNPSSTPRPSIWGRVQTEATFTDLPGNGRSDVAIVVPTQRRGWIELPRARLYTAYPVGLFHAWAWVQPPARCLVYPRPEPHGPGLPTGAEAGTGRPEHHGDEEWAGLRDYRPGDPSRLIAWKVIARTDEMVTKTFADHQSEELRLVFERIELADTEARLARLARWVIEAHARELKYALVMPEDTIGPATGDTHKHRCLRALAEFPG